MRRFVLADPISLEDVRARGEALGWNIGAPVATDVSSETPIRSRDGERAFLFIEDRLIAAKYFRLDVFPMSPDAAQIVEHFPIVDHEALAEIIGAADTSEAALDALSAACASANESFDPLIFEFVKRSMGSSEPEVRRFACIGATYAGWPELGGPLLRLAEHDADERVRRAALLALRGLNEENWHDPAIGARLERQGT